MFADESVLWECDLLGEPVDEVIGTRSQGITDWGAQHPLPDLDRLVIDPRASMFHRSIEGAARYAQVLAAEVAAVQLPTL
jgi:hypothetical protein